VIGQAVSGTLAACGPTTREHALAAAGTSGSDAQRVPDGKLTVPGPERDRGPRARPAASSPATASARGLQSGRGRGATRWSQRRARQEEVLVLGVKYQEQCERHEHDRRRRTHRGSPARGASRSGAPYHAAAREVPAGSFSNLDRSSTSRSIPPRSTGGPARSTGCCPRRRCPRPTSRRPRSSRSRRWWSCPRLLW
jgi:hypothetical protein